MIAKTFALIDCNNFFASCERVFDPSLADKPIVVLSNNDGCVIARSNESKKIGIPMGMPYFKCKDLIITHDVRFFYSNYQLYGDMSHRVIETIKSLVQHIEIYSIDEAFADLSNIPPSEILPYAVHIREVILKWTGITVSIGVGPSKTLAKVANYIAKKHTKTGVYDIRDEEVQTRALNKIDIEEVWGISKGWGGKLRSIGVNTALELRNVDSKTIRTRFGVVMERTVMELRGKACLFLEDSPNRKNIISSRSFGKEITNIEDLEEAIANYVAKACVKLRRQMSRAGGIQVFLQTNRFQAAQNNEDYHHETSYKFTLPSSDTSHIIEIAKACMQKIYRTGIKYRKAGITLLDCKSSTCEQQNFFEVLDYKKSDKLMSTLDRINHLMGLNSVFYAAQGIERSWTMKSGSMSPCYTTHWNELPSVL